jgi:[DsrC]-trisulfide reductase subunit M
MNALYALFAVVFLVLFVFIGVSVAGLQVAFGVLVPYAAVSLFLVGIVYRVLKWASAPVPFRITTVCGQQKSLPWIQYSPLESPPNAVFTAARMALEILAFRSLFRNTRVVLAGDEQHPGGKRIVYSTNLLLWLGALAFHYCFLVILLRHFRFFTEPVAFFVPLLQALDGFFQIGAPVVYMTSLIIIVALGYLLFRRFANPQVRYISLPSDYFALFLLLGVTISGVLMRHFFKVDVVKAKELALGLIGFHPVVPDGIGSAFYIHLFLVSVLVAYFPFSKLMHMAGVFLSPTRNLSNDNRARRHVNPWNYPVEVHTYEEWEEEFRDKIKAAGLPLEKG